MARYESSVVEAGDRLVRELRKAKDAARVAGDLQEFDRLSELTDQFLDADEVPTGAIGRRYRSRVERLRTILKRDYDEFVAAAARDGDVPRAKRLQEDWERFENGQSRSFAELKMLREFVASLATFEATNFAIGRLQNGEWAFLNRSYVWDGIADELPFERHLLLNGGAKQPIAIEVAKPGWLYVAISGEDRETVLPAMQDSGWEAIPRSFRYATNPPTRMTLFRRRVEVGPLQITRRNWSGPMPLLP